MLPGRLDRGRSGGGDVLECPLHLWGIAAVKVLPGQVYSPGVWGRVFD